MTHYSPLYGPGYTNHLPMFEQALKRLNLGKDLIDKRCDDYIHTTQLRDLSSESIERSQLEDNYLKAYVQYTERLTKEDKEQVIEELVNQKEKALDAHLYHGMIRLAYAVDNPDIDELAKALAFWDVLDAPRTNINPTKKTTVPRDNFTDLMELRASMDFDFQHVSLSNRINLFMENEELMGKVTELHLEEDSENKVAFILGLWFLTTRDFYVLHIVNGYNAMLRLKPYIHNFDLWLKTFWIKAQLYSLLTDERLPIIDIEVKPWDVILTELHATTDVHDIKLIYACMELGKLTNRKIFNKIAHIVSHKYWLHQ